MLSEEKEINSENSKSDSTVFVLFCFLFLVTKNLWSQNQRNGEGQPTVRGDGLALKGLPRYKHPSYLWNKDVFTLIIYRRFFLDGRSNVDSFLSDRHTETRLWLSDMILRSDRRIMTAWERHLQVVKHVQVSQGQTGGIHHKWAQSATYRPLRRVHLRHLPGCCSMTTLTRCIKTEAGNLAENNSTNELHK